MATAATARIQTIETHIHEHKDKLDLQMQSKYQEMVNDLNMKSGWTIMENRPEYVLMKTKSADSPYYKYKASTSIRTDMTPKNFLQFMYCSIFDIGMSEEEKDYLQTLWSSEKYKAMCADLQNPAMLSMDMDSMWALIHLTYNSPFPTLVKHRDFLFQCQIRFAPSRTKDLSPTAMYVGTSVDDEFASFIPLKHKHKRGKLHTIGWCIEQRKDEHGPYLNTHFFLQCDPKVKIVGNFVNEQLAKRMSLILDYKSIIEDAQLV